MSMNQYDLASGIDVDLQASRQAELSSSVKSYFLPMEEIEKLYGKAGQRQPKKHVGWPECGEPNLRHIARKSAEVEEEIDQEDVNPEEEVGLEEIERIESGATDPAWSFDNCKW